MDKNDGGQQEAKHQGGFLDRIGNIIDYMAANKPTHQEHQRQMDLEALEECYQKEKARSNSDQSGQQVCYGLSVNVIVLHLTEKEIELK